MFKLNSIEGPINLKYKIILQREIKLITKTGISVHFVFLVLSKFQKISKLFLYSKFVIGSLWTKSIQV